MNWLCSGNQQGTVPSGKIGQFVSVDLLKQSLLQMLPVYMFEVLVLCNLPMEACVAKYFRRPK